MDLVGQTIREYQIESVLGTGGFGDVYLARQTNVDRHVAIKMISPRLANDASFQARFDDEAQTIASLEHPHIIPLYDYWRDEGGAYLVMRYVSGGNLRDIMQRQEAMALNQVQRIIGQISEALDVAHEAGIVHRDIKPQNILLDQRGNAYLTDFGIAVAEGAHDDNVTGTIAYLSPEQLRSEPATHQSDIYALGILMFEMLTGQHPFDDAVHQMIQAHINEEVPSVLSFRPDLPEVVDIVIQGATQKDPDLRYQQATQMTAELTGAPLDRTVEIVKPKLLRRATSPLERNRNAMIQTVRTYWIEGVLDNSLQGKNLLDLELVRETDYVSHPWSGLVSNRALMTRSSDIIELFEAFNGKMLILGDPGAGKTTVLLSLARLLLDQAERDLQFPLPVILNLSSWAEKRQSLAEWIASELNSKYQVPQSVAAKWVADDQLLLLLDGLDEMDDVYRDACVQAINIYRDEHGFVDMVVCSRLGDYEELSERLKLNGAVRVEPLSDEQVDRYLQRLGDETLTLRNLIQHNADMRELSHSPLMLGIMITAYRGVSQEHIPDMDSLEQQRDYFLDLYVHTSYQRRLTDKPFTLEETRHYLHQLAQLMTRHGEMVFRVEELQFDWLAPDRRDVVFRVFQVVAYLAFVVAWLVPSLFLTNPASFSYPYFAIFGAVWGGVLLFGYERLTLLGGSLVFLVATLAARFAVFQSIPDLQAAALQSIIPYALVLPILWSLYRRTGQTARTIKTVDALHYSLSAVRPSALVIGLLGGLVIAIALLSDGFNPIEFAVHTFGTGLVALVATGFRADRIELSTRVNEGIRRSLVNGLQMAFVMAIVSLLLATSAFYPRMFDTTLGAPALFNILPFAVTGFFIYGGASVIKHYLVRRELEQAQVIPRDFTGFLEHAANLALLRRVGGGYIFIHRYLLEHFAEGMSGATKATQEFEQLQDT